jgi:hypothetical protein
MQNKLPNSCVVKVFGETVENCNHRCDRDVQIADSDVSPKSASESAQRTVTGQKQRPWPVITLGIY